MVHRDKLVAFIDKYLDAGAVRDAGHNGLQVEGREQVRRVAFGVSASLECMRRAAAWGADMLITHHGLLWGKAQPFTGPLAAKLRLLLSEGISLASWHLPLDRHPETGNNARLLKLLGARGLKPFGDYDCGGAIGWRGALPRPLEIGEIASALALKLDAEPLCFRFGKEKIRTVAAVSGGAARMFEQAAAAGLDLYITGEVSEQTQEYARETRSNFIAAGHYNTEKPGVLALAGVVEKKFGVKTDFFDVPNPA
jgi:dinuclear metal center YbgI/SA1388 family protein